jgi:hypothetical protein
MKAKAAFVIGAALGYLFGTDKGRAKLEEAKGWASKTWQDPRVQEKVSEVSSTATRFAKDKTATLKDKATGSSGSPTEPGTTPGTTPGPTAPSGM